ncbi:MAG TPA: bacteriohopanetetrol glucosamine biosynthesis glycosyltransferase HpnI [Nitrospirota bacterium]
MERLLPIMTFLPWAASLAYGFISFYLTIKFFRERSGPAQVSSNAVLPPVTLLKPLHGADSRTRETLSSFINQDYPEFQVIFGVTDPDDPARKVAERLIAEHPDRDLSISVRGTDAPNGKVGNIENMARLARYDIIAISDSDILAARDALRMVAEGFADPAVGVVTCLYRGAGARDIGSAFESLTINTDFLPQVLTAERLEGLTFALGALMAVRKEALDKIGGFSALRDFLADDYKLGNLAYRAGYKVKLSGVLLDSVQESGSVGGYFSHQLRWARTYRACRPKGYFLSVLTKTTALAIIFLLSTGFSPAGWSVFAASLAIRQAQAMYLEARYIKAAGALRWYWLLPVKDIVSIIIWASSFTGNKVRWGNESFLVDGEGRMAKL